MDKEKYSKACEIKELALDLVESQLNGDIASVDAKELGEVADIAKDMAELIKYCNEAEYYSKVVESMETATNEEKNWYMNKYSEPKGMHYSMNEHSINDGKAWESRKCYIEAIDKTLKAKELERYMSDLSDDITDMMDEMDNNEKAQLRNKLVQLSNKIV